MGNIETQVSLYVKKFEPLIPIVMYTNLEKGGFTTSITEKEMSVAS